MTDSKWDETVDGIEQKFGILERDVAEVVETDDTGAEFTVKIESIIFDGPAGKMKLVRTSRPRILDKQVLYHKTAGGGAKVKYILSDTEFTHALKAYVLNPASGEYEEINFNA